MNDSTNAITLIGAQLAEFDAVEAGLSDLEKKYKGVAFAVSTTKGMGEAIAARADCRTPRVAVGVRRSRDEPAALVHVPAADPPAPHRKNLKKANATRSMSA